MTRRRSWLILALLAVLIGTATLTLLTSQAWVLAIGAVIIVATLLRAARDVARVDQAPTDAAIGATSGALDPSRRRFLATAGASGAIAAVGGIGVGRVISDFRAQPSTTQAQDQMARNLGSGYMELVDRGYFPGRSGEVQLAIAPFNSANYAQESISLVPDDPRSSHAAPWLYLERVPLVFYGPGRVPRTTNDMRTTLADIAPTTAALCGTTFDTPDGHALEQVLLNEDPPREPPAVVVTFVIDGGGWNVLHQWPDAWPNLRRIMGQGANFTNAIHGSNPAVTACAHATIGTGAFPSSHGVSGHFIRFPDGSVEKAYGEDGQADTSVIELPTFAEHWQEHTNNQAWVGEIGYQIWHLGMIGRPAGYRGTKPVGVYYDEDHTGLWQSQNPEFYRLPGLVPPRSILEAKLQSYVGPTDGAQFTPKGGASSCCAPPIVEYQGDLIVATLDAEPVGRTEATSLLTINYKAPDYAGHIYNMQNPHEEMALRAVDAELGRLVDELDRRFLQDYVLIVTADHGQCPAVTQAAGVRLDPIQLTADIDEVFGRVVTAVQDVRPAEIYLQPAAIHNDPHLAARVAAWLRTYTYGENYMQYPRVPKGAIQWDQMHHLEFAGAFSADYVESMSPSAIAQLGAGVYTATTDTPIPPLP